MFRQFARDSAVLAGIVIAALGVWLSRKVGNPHFDPGTTIMIGLVLTGAAFVFARKSGGLLMGDCIDRDQLALIGKLMAADIAVESVGHQARRRAWCVTRGHGYGTFTTTFAQCARQRGHADAYPARGIPCRKGRVIRQRRQYRRRQQEISASLDGSLYRVGEKAHGVMRYARHAGRTQYSYLLQKVPASGGIGVHGDLLVTICCDALLMIFLWNRRRCYSTITAAAQAGSRLRGRHRRAM